ncbi:MOSC domain-containing protein [Alteribacillus iranensis]|uniref:MOSC domain-containing protein n=1 Tax=Alteribacillus iranensis TaxID=930128 RepID=A0A1I2EBL0_9BACI|nr:MOSC domain-containing protein [Alteribacillus iranensis]SFE89851.1 hypothetical protein SAMN05192532_105229 [Alteribacillus iranensis]
MKNINVVSLRRYPVKSMMGEELNACEVTEKGVLGDRAYGIIDKETGRLANAKNPKKWPNMFQYRASFVEPPQQEDAIPPVRITCPDGTSVTHSDPEAEDILSRSFQRNVFVGTPSTSDREFEGLIPENVSGLENPGSVFSKAAPAGTFFDIGMVHIVTTSSLEELARRTPGSRIEARRFRPNLILNVENGESFEENSWVGKTLSIGNEVKLKIVQNTKRCIMTTLPQGDLPNDLNVLRSAVKENDGNIGIYANVLQSGTIHIGDRVTIDGVTNASS